MDDMKNIFNYKYRIEDLNAIVEKRRKGIECMIPQDMMDEVILREKEIALNIKNQIGEDIGLDDEETMELIKRHNSLIEDEIEKERRNIHAEEFITLDITDDERKEMEELCGTSYVRILPNHPYHATDEELYEDKERREIYARMKKIGNMYYNPTDWRNAMITLMDAWKYSYEHDYPGIPDSLKMGHIKLNRQMPKLMLNYSQIINDEKLLMGILNGDVQCKEMNESSDAVVKYKRPKDDEVEGIPFDKVGRVVSPIESAYESYLARMNVPYSFATMAHQLTNPIYARFSTDKIIPQNKKPKLNQFGKPITFDFTQPGMGKKAYKIMHNCTETVGDFAKSILEANDNKVTAKLSGSVMNDFAHAFNRNGANQYNNYTTEVANPQLNPSQEVIAQEQALLNMMKQFNPTK